jgi:hypothetical protein
MGTGCGGAPTALQEPRKLKVAAGGEAPVVLRTKESLMESLSTGQPAEGPQF